MTMVVMVALGTYAINAASTEIRTSGFARQALQTRYLTEFGVIGTAHEMWGAKASLYVRLMMDPQYRDNRPVGGDSRRAGQTCNSLSSAPSDSSDLTLACRLVPMTELGQSWNTLASPSGADAGIAPLVAYDPTKVTTPGSLGPIPVSGTFYTELTEPVKQTNLPGYQIDLPLCFYQMVVSSWGMTTPQGLSDTATYTGETIQLARARVTAGPVQCSQ
jgi:hypothetical protein